MIPYHPDQQAQMCAQESQDIFEKLGEAYRHDFGISRFNQAETVDDFLACRDLFRGLQDPFWAAECDEKLLLLYWPEGEKVSFYGEEDLALRKESGDVNGEGIALRYLGQLETLRGNLDGAFQRLFDALACFDTVGNRTLAALTHNELATDYLIKGDHEGALKHMKMGRTLAEELNKALVLEFSIHQAGMAWEMQEYELAVRYCEEALELARNLPIEVKHYDTMWILVRVALSQGNTASARAYLRNIPWPEMLSSYVDRGVFFGYALALGLLSVLEGQVQRAVSLLGAQDRWLSVKQNFLFPGERNEYEQALASARAALGEEGFCQAWEAGRAMTEGQVLEFAMQVLGGEAG
jgi:tetratricopeptide (TPR) repeat protein